MLHGQLLLAVVGLVTLLVTIPVIGIVYAGVIQPVTSTTARIVARAAGEEPPDTPGRTLLAAAHRPRNLPTSDLTPEYTVRTRCGCGAAVEVNASIPEEIQRAMLEPFFTAHEPCMAQALAGEPGAEPMLSTITRCCGQQLTADLVHTERDELARQSDAFMEAHRECASARQATSTS